MKILHYFLGFPPYRSGGMTTFACDLMLTQIEAGDEVSAIWPGRIELFSKKVKIKKRTNNNKIENYEIINPLPVSYDEGITRKEEFVKHCDKDVFVTFFKSMMPDVIHIHTFMGLHKEFVLAAAECGIKTIFTTHDFFPICPKVTLYRDGQICECNHMNCPNCNSSALSMTKIILLQEPVYRMIKDLHIVKKFRKNHRDRFYNRTVNGSSYVTPNDYKKLRDYYASMYELIDTIHFNSTVTKKVYEKYFPSKKSVTIPITHRHISDNRKKKEFLHNKLKISYLGPGGGAKGFFLLKEALDSLWTHRQDFVLNIFFEPLDSSPYINVKERYKYDQLKEVFDDTDILIVPSIWYETFGFTALEALSFGTPVIVSGNVGAKDVIEEGCGIIIEDISPDKIVDIINNLDVNELQKMNNNILEKQTIITSKAMYRIMREKCYVV